MLREILESFDWKEFGFVRLTSENSKGIERAGLDAVVTLWRSAKNFSGKKEIG